MHNLEKLIGEWRETMRPVRGVTREILDELENHLRENVDQLVRRGANEHEAFERAVAQLGSVHPIASEFQKLNRGTWLPMKLAIGLGITIAMACVGLMIVALGTGRLTLLLASHALAVTLGYGSTFLIGALGICFVAQRSFSDMTTARMRAVTRVTFVLGCVAVVLTMLGVVLGAVWAKGAWGRFWAWDVKEIGGFSVMIWQILFLLAHRFAPASARSVLVFSILGNVVVALAWFGGHLLSERPQAFGTSVAILLAAVIANCAVFFAGLAPAGWMKFGSRRG